MASWRTPVIPREVTTENIPVHQTATRVIALEPPGSKHEHHAGANLRIQTGPLVLDTQVLGTTAEENQESCKIKTQDMSSVYKLNA